MTQTVTIVGGGLAGMVAAIRLRQRGFSVKIFEASHRLGGKAGADPRGGDHDEHGWHLFPLWYLNIWQLAEEFGFRQNFLDKTRYAYMRRGEFPRLRYLENPFSMKTAFHNLFNGITNPIDSFLYQFTGLDLMSQPLGKKAELDQVTVNGFARSRFYCTETVVSQLEDTVSRASAIESFEMSAMTVRNVMRYWLTYHSPWFRVLSGDLQTKFIDPLAAGLSGCDIQLNSKVVRIRVDGSAATGLDVQDDAGNVVHHKVEQLLVATPILDTRELLDQDVLACAPELGGTLYLRSRIMAGMTIYFKSRIDGIPQNHINFVGSPYALSMIDVTELWQSTDRSIVSFVASDYTTLQKHATEGALEVLLADLRRYLPFLRDEDIERIDLQPHIAQPLFANTAGAWPRRPSATTKATNIFVAGDYCKSDIDLTCMEGAVSTGLLAAEAIRSRTGVGEPIKVLVPKVRPRWIILILKWLGLPLAGVLSLITRLRGPAEH